jgi:hypothetical protein
MSLNQTGIDGHALTIYDTFRDAVGDSCLEQVVQQFALARVAMPVF